VPIQDGWLDCIRLKTVVKTKGCRLIVFAKAPIPGQVKTRLIPSMGATAAAALHEKLAFHCLSKAVDAAVGPVELWCSPTTVHPFFIRCSMQFQIELHTQPAGDLGRRMGVAFENTLKRASSALLIGTDCPSLTQTDLREASEAFVQGVDAVIGPAEDGGYVLLGLRQYNLELLTDISWGTESVLNQTRGRLRRLGWRWHELPERWDVDRPEDIERLILEGYFT
jgi:rSAM/selenodomain-associated transferase 1